MNDDPTKGRSGLHERSESRQSDEASAQEPAPAQEESEVEAPADVAERPGGTQEGGSTESGDPTSQTIVQRKLVPGSLATRAVEHLANSSFGPPVVLLLALAAFGLGTYALWWEAIGGIVNWSNADGASKWRWVLGGPGVFFAAVGPAYLLIGVTWVAVRVLDVAGEKAEAEARSELDKLEEKIRGSDEPVDYASYSRKAMDAYHHMGQNQVRLSFYVGVSAMVFGFLFLLGGLLVQVLDTTKLGFLRSNPDVDFVVVAGGIIIEFIAATFLWIYSAAIVQHNRYYRRQMMIHSGLLGVAIAQKMDKDVDTVLNKIIETMITPDQEGSLPALWKRGPAKSGAST